jgi:hypothetical protein
VKVALVPTGRTEWHGLPHAFKALFPAHDFGVLPTAEEVLSHPDDFPSPGFTSFSLSADHEIRPPEAATELVRRAAQAAIGDTRARTPAADLVVVLDDLELANMAPAQQERVTRVFRAAVVRHLNALDRRFEAKTRAALLERVSFHLLVPMVEALFFADSEALQRAGVPAQTAVTFAATCDPEDFQTNDPAYLSATQAACPRWSSLPQGRQKKQQRPKWLGGQARDRHPKGYLQWLCRDGAAKNCTTYRETEDGGRALAHLRWPQLLSRPAEHLRYLRALLADLSEGLAESPTTGPVLGAQAQLTSRFTPRREPVLRNL